MQLRFFSRSCCFIHLHQLSDSPLLFESKSEAKNEGDSHASHPSHCLPPRPSPGCTIVLGWVLCIFQSSLDILINQRLPNSFGLLPPFLKSAPIKRFSSPHTTRRTPPSLGQQTENTFISNGAVPEVAIFGHLQASPEMNVMYYPKHCDWMVLKTQNITHTLRLADLQKTSLTTGLSHLASGLFVTYHQIGFTLAPHCWLALIKT